MSEYFSNQEYVNSLHKELTSLRAELEEAKKKQADDAKWLQRAGGLIELHMKERDDAKAENARLQSIIDGAEWGTLEGHHIEILETQEQAKMWADKFDLQLVRIIKIEKMKK